MEYKTLEGNSLQALKINTPSFDGTETSFLATSTFVYTLFFMAIVTAAFYRYVVAGALRMQASEFSIRQSNQIIKQVTLGLLGVFSLFLLLFTVNKGLVSGDISLSGLKSQPAIQTGSVSSSGTGSGSSSKSCEKPEDVLARLRSGNICGNTSCKVLSGCNWQPYESIINSATAGNAELRKMAIVTMCKESSARPRASNVNPNGSYDCGLMQINQTTPCVPNPTPGEQEANIRAGINLMKQKINAVQRYPVIQGVPALGNAFSSYNCCANGTVPATQSADCTTANGFPAGFPKWACPINPGDGQFNMCVVKNYACELVACMGQL